MKKIFSFAVASLFVASSAFATSITDVSVTIGSTVFSGWSFPVILTAGQDLVLTQTTGFNFDTSDEIGLPIITVTADGKTTRFFDTRHILDVAGQGTQSQAANEAQLYGDSFNGPGYLMYLGYADTIHTDTCGIYAASLGLAGSSTCLPEIFSTAIVFQGNGSDNIGLIEPQDGFHCGDKNCYDAGVIRFVATDDGTTRGVPAVPEPTSLVLLGTGLLYVGYRIRKRSNGMR